MRVINNKVFFYGSSEIYSNWHRCRFIIEGITFNCSEQAMMYYKAKMFRDYDTANKILKSKNPREQKQLGREVKNFDESYWINNREEIMYRILYEKFTQNEDFKKELLKYKQHEFVEASPYDKIWGIGLDQTNDLILDESNWRGQNLLGKCITRLKNDLLLK